MQPIAVAQMKNRIKVVVGDHVSFPALDVAGPQDEVNLVAEKTVLDPAIKRQQGRVIVGGISRPLLKIKREQGETVAGDFLHVLAAGKTEKLKYLKPVFFSEPVIGQQWVEHVELFVVNLLVEGVGKERGGSPLTLGFFLLKIKKWPQNLRAVSRR